MQQETKTTTRPTPNVLIAGDLRVDLGLQRVQRDGTTIPLPKLSFDVLVVLLRAAPNVVSNEDLMSQAWPGVIVSPETVTQRLKLLRDSLGDDPRQPRYIEGLRSRGYRFMQPVAALADGLGPGTPNTQVSPPASATGMLRRRLLWPAVLAAAALALVLGSALIKRDLAKSNATPALARSEFDRAVAVLPFDQWNAGDTDQYLGPAIAESVLSRLSTVRGLIVIARDSSFRHASSEAKPAELSRELGARYFVTGSAQKLGDQLRVNVRLLDGPTQAQLWSQQFTQPLTRLFNLQDEIGSSVARELDARIGTQGAARPQSTHVPLPEAYVAFLRGRSLLGRFTVSDAEAGAAELTRATALDPGFGAAYVALYDARMQSASLRREDKAAARRRYRTLLEQATALGAPQGSLLYARAMWDDEDDAVSRQHYELAMQLDPNNGRGITAYSQFLMSRDRQEAARILERALRIDPQSPRANFQAAMLSIDTLGAGIEQQVLKVLELDPKFYPALMRYSKYQWQGHGQNAQAIALIERAIADDPENPWGRHLAAVFYLETGDVDAAQNVVAGYSVCEASTRAMFALYRHDWRAAGLAAMDPGSYQFAGPERWAVTMALRDYALKSGERAKVERLLASRYELPESGPWKLDFGNFREAQYIGELLLADGKRDEGLERLRRVVEWIDHNEKLGPVYNQRTMARILMLTGQRDAALAMLAESFRQGDHTQWWHALEQDPIWDPVREDPRFKTVVRDVHEWLAGQQRQLAAMRVQGIVPKRGPVP